MAPFGNSSIGIIIVFSIVSSVALILTNKVIMKEYGFNYVWTLTTFHMVTTHVGLSAFAALKGFTPKGFPTQRDIWSVAAMGVGSIAFNNFSLKTNSVGLYQIFKLCCIPVMVVLQTYNYGATFSARVKFSLLILLAGIGMATVTDVSLNTVGCFWGFMAVLSTTQYQTWQGTKQKEHSLSGIQITHQVSRYQSVITGIMALMTECTWNDDGIMKHEIAGKELLLIGFTCLLAISVNVCSYALIGKTSSVTYQVVGHAKTCLILAGGFVISGAIPSTKNLMGVLVAMVGVVMYGHFKSLDAKSVKEDGEAPSTAKNLGGYSRVKTGSEIELRLPSA